MADHPYHMAIASQVLEDKEYASFYRHAQGYVIMDVPTYETNGVKAFDLEPLQQAIDIISPHEVVLPDRWDVPWRENLSLAQDAADHLYAVTRRGNLHFMVIPHATTLVDYIEACKHLVSIRRVGAIGIAKRVEKEMGIPRIEVVMAVTAAFPKIPLHLMGCSDHMEDIYDPIVRKASRSMDTAKFIVWGLDLKRPVYGGLPAYTGRGGDYFAQEVNEAQLICIRRNIAYWANYCGRS